MKRGFREKKTSNVKNYISASCCREEVMKAMPQYEEMKRRARKKEREAAKAAARAEEEATQAKRQKIDIADDEVSYLKRLLT